ncbi:hydroxymethylbilane synthase [Geosporobacter ferrireducens]|uniref:Porphobilinogen deaminase n=1 Tax=Geosporobacter ferrireducens TaxID=1424294 RepID=A0A1D8GND6_9FIRM|nr:hydroxymethylbilane synthase [Geosporobacter ferrireducens]AOT72394.1 hydroxymethylbilane synthase [Geosporobacter ferrireducens]MTI56350.1 hydroxymethylbilane synthase [Geosporobacter ferrireducens]
MDRRKVIVGSRASELALTQTHWVIRRLKEKFPHITFEVVEIKTIGDKILDKTLDKIGGKGLFVKEIETALLQKEIDMAVHSMKDVPTEMTPELTIGAISDREDVRDVLISRNGVSLRNLPAGAKIGTSSLRRAAQLLAFRPDLHVEPIRGNIATRIGKIESLHLDGVILAAAGVLRMGWKNQVTEYISTEICTPAVGQGALGIQIRQEDSFIASLVQVLNNSEVEVAVKAERSFMAALKGGCHVPIGAYAVFSEGMLHMDTVVASPDGREVIRLSMDAPEKEYTELGNKAAKESMEKGAEKILKNIEVGE